MQTPEPARRYVVTEIDLADECRHVRYHELALPFVTAPGGYRETLKLNRFWSGRDRTGNPNCRDPVNQRLYHVRREDELPAHPRAPGVPTLQHDSMTALFTAIGYDPRRGRYAPAAPRRRQSPERPPGPCTKPPPPDEASHAGTHARRLHG